MAPIYDTDVAHERWDKAEWKYYELWEKIEQRLRRKKRIWILATILLCLVLLAIPVMIDQWPKWRALALSRQLAEVVGQARRVASMEHRPVRIRFLGGGLLTYRIERVDRCDAQAGELIEERSLVKGGGASEFRLVEPEVGEVLGIPGIVNRYCYDPLKSFSQPVEPSAEFAGFGIIPARDLTKDLSQARVDRVSVLLLSRASAKISFE